MAYIKGKVRQLIYEGDSGYKVGLFRVKETNDSEMEDFLNKTITFTGMFVDLNFEDTYQFNGSYVYHERYGHQFKVDSYERVLPTGKEALIEFLSSDLIKGCGLKTAIKIVDTLGEDCLKKIKENPDILLTVKGVTETRAENIYNSIMSYSETDEILIKLKEYGFSISEATTLLNTFGSKVLALIDTNIYTLVDYIPFNKLDQIYLEFIHNSEGTRIRACIIETMKRVCFNEGNTYLILDELRINLNNEFRIELSSEELETYLEELINDNLIKKVSSYYYLMDYFLDEYEIAESLAAKAMDHSSRFISDDDIKYLENNYGVKYNSDQLKAIKTSLNNRLTIIAGGPGTGKTTIINAITKLYIDKNRLKADEIISDIALLAPTGRAAKRMSETTSLPAMTIHRYLKWNKDNNEFQVNEYNKNHHKLIIVDEMSMLDTNLFASLLRGIDTSAKLILVGDPFQLPSVGPGNILKDLIDSDYFNYVPLNRIYRQTSNSYIPVLAEEIRNNSLSDTYLEQKDDYNFIVCNSYNIKYTLRKILEMSINKGLNEKDIQVLAPLYKGENGIDLLNEMIRDIFNPGKKNMIKLGDVYYKEGDKVLQLVNDVDNNVFNGDIGYIEYIDEVKGETTINFLGNYVIYKKEDLYNIKHAYAITIHKSQGSEFSHVILPVSKSYSKMLYNKLIYTAVSRAKKSIIIIGEKDAFKNAISNDYASLRKTGLRNFLDVYFKDNGE